MWAMFSSTLLSISDIDDSELSGWSRTPDDVLITYALTFDSCATVGVAHVSCPSRISHVSIFPV